MREILFRGISRDTQTFVFGDLLRGEDGDCDICVNDLDTNEKNKFPVYPETVGQFTGLYDKNGTKIFEGDIVEIKDFTHGCALNYKQPTSRWVVHWKEGTARFCIDYMDILPFDFTKSEIVGNIHDNSELLKEGAQV